MSNQFLPINLLKHFKAISMATISKGVSLEPEYQHKQVKIVIDVVTPLIQSFFFLNSNIGLKSQASSSNEGLAMGGKRGNVSKLVI